MSHVARWKIEAVEELSRMMEEYPVVALVRVDGIPGPQMREMRNILRNKARFRMAKKSLIRLALRGLDGKKGISGLAEGMEGHLAVVASDKNPFTLYRVIESTKTPAPAKPGDVAPADIVVKAGETPFKPGPIVSELQKAGIPATIESGKVVIKKDKLLIREGEVIPDQVAKMLTRLGIYPMTVGLNLISLYEDGIIYGPDELAIDIEAFRAEVVEAIRRAFNLAMNSAYPTTFTAKPLVQKAHRDALAVAVAAAIPVPESVRLLLSKAHTQMLALAMKIPEALDDGLKDLVGAARPAVSEPEVSPEGEPGDRKEDDEGGEEEVSEEEAAAGLGALFG